MKYIGIDVGGTNLKAGLVDESGLILATHVDGERQRGEGRGQDGLQRER